MIQSQSQFGGGINTLLPRHRIPDGSSVDVVDADVFDGTLKSTPTFGTTDGGQVYYYEAGASWVGSAGFSDRAVQDQLIVDSSTGNLTSASHVGAGTTATFNTPLTMIVDSVTPSTVGTRLPSNQQSVGCLTQTPS